MSFQRRFNVSVLFDLFNVLLLRTSWVLVGTNQRVKRTLDFSVKGKHFLFPLVSRLKPSKARLGFIIIRTFFCQIQKQFKAAMLE